MSKLSWMQLALGISALGLVVRSIIEFRRSRSKQVPKFRIYTKLADSVWWLALAVSQMFSTLPIAWRWALGATGIIGLIVGEVVDRRSRDPEVDIISLRLRSEHEANEQRKAV